MNVSARSDIEWWSIILSEWNGRAMMCSLTTTQARIELVSDASGRWGCGAPFDGSMFQLMWAGAIRVAHITVQELVPIVIPAAIWGESWRGKTVHARCDNAAVVAIINKNSSKDQQVMYLIQCLSFTVAQFQFVLVPSHIRGVENTLADALSRDNLPLFLAQYPQAARFSTHPSRIVRSAAVVILALDISEVDRTVEFYFLQGLAPSTRRTYNSAKKLYINFCGKWKISPIPTSEHLLCHLISSGKCIS